MPRYSVVVDLSNRTVRYAADLAAPAPNGDRVAVAEAGALPTDGAGAGTSALRDTTSRLAARVRGSATELVGLLARHAAPRPNGRARSEKDKLPQPAS